MAEQEQKTTISGAGSSPYIVGKVRHVLSLEFRRGKKNDGDDNNGRVRVIYPKPQNGVVTFSAESSSSSSSHQPEQQQPPMPKRNLKKENFAPAGRQFHSSIMNSTGDKFPLRLPLPPSANRVPNNGRLFATRNEESTTRTGSVAQLIWRQQRQKLSAFGPGTSSSQTADYRNLTNVGSTKPKNNNYCILRPPSQKVPKSDATRPYVKWRPAQQLVKSQQSADRNILTPSGGTVPQHFGTVEFQVANGNETVEEHHFDEVCDAVVLETRELLKQKSKEEEFDKAIEKQEAIISKEMILESIGNALDKLRSDESLNYLLPAAELSKAVSDSSGRKIEGGSDGRSCDGEVDEFELALRKVEEEMSWICARCLTYEEHRKVVPAKKRKRIVRKGKKTTPPKGSELSSPNSMLRHCYSTSMQDFIRDIEDHSSNKAGESSMLQRERKQNLKCVNDNEASVEGSSSSLFTVVSAALLSQSGHEGAEKEQLMAELALRQQKELARRRRKEERSLSCARCRPPPPFKQYMCARGRPWDGRRKHRNHFYFMMHPRRSFPYEPKFSGRRPAKKKLFPSAPAQPSAQPFAGAEFVPRPTDSAQQRWGKGRYVVTSEMPLELQYNRFLSEGSPSLSLNKSTIHGVGVFAEELVDQGRLVLEYRGELIRNSLIDLREAKYRAQGFGSYMFALDKNYTVDATKKGSIARFINHSCDPNCLAKVISFNNTKKIVLFASRLIQPGEELSYDYKLPYEAEKLLCLCRSERCRKYLN